MREHKDDMMNERDDWLLNLYEGPDEARRSADPDLAAEETALREMKSLLDARPGRKPDARTVRAVLEAAGGDSAPVGARIDRAPARRTRTVGLRVGAASALIVALIAVVGVLRLDAPSSEVPPDLSVETPPPFESSIEAGELNPPASSLQGTSRGQDAAAAEMLTQLNVPPDTSGAVALAVSGSDPDLTWDQRDEVIELHQRMQRIGAGADVDWGAPPVPLEMMPTGRGTGVLPVVQRP